MLIQTMPSSKAFAAAAFVIALLVGRLSGQSPAISVGGLAGSIKDDIGRPLPGVSVDVKGAGIHRVAVTTAAGDYDLKDLPR